MNEERLPIAAACLLALTELLHTGEVPRIEINLSDPETISLTIDLHPRDEIVFELLLGASDYPLDAVVTAFDYVQDYLAENGPSRAEARPTCRPGHAHPAMCQRRDDAVVIVCPRDLEVVRRIV
jgi:hypothetical protein